MPITNVFTAFVSGNYQNLFTGMGETGTVEFIPSSPVLTDGPDKIILTAPPFIATLYSAGNFQIELPCTDNSQLNPSGFTYTIVEHVTNMHARTTTGVALPHSLGTYVDITELIP